MSTYVHEKIPMYKIKLFTEIDGSTFSLRIKNGDENTSIKPF